MVEDNNQEFHEEEILDDDIVAMEDQEDPNKREVYVPVEPPKVEPGMIVRTIVFAVAIINAGLAMFGSDVVLDVDQQMVYEVLSGLFLVGSSFFAWFKDNDVSKVARKRNDVTNQVEELKDKKKKKKEEKGE